MVTVFKVLYNSFSGYAISYWSSELVRVKISNLVIFLYFLLYFSSIPQYAGRIPTATHTFLDKIKQVVKLLPKFWTITRFWDNLRDDPRNDKCKEIASLPRSLRSCSQWQKRTTMNKKLSWLEKLSYNKNFSVFLNL